VHVHGGEDGVGQQRGDVAADAEERDVAEVEQPGETDDDVETDGRRGENTHPREDRHPRRVAVLGEGERDGCGKTDEVSEQAVAVESRAKRDVGAERRRGRDGRADGDRIGQELRLSLDVEADHEKREHAADGHHDQRQIAEHRQCR